MSRRLCVSLHDVCPATAPDCRAVLRHLDQLGIRRRSLLVIPNRAGGAADDDAAFAAWLREQAAAGDEIVLHGWRHGRAPEHPAPRGPARWVDALLARGAGEFYAVDQALAAAWIDDGLARLRRIGLRPVGFVAPAWLYSPGAARAVGEAGFGYLTTHLRLRAADGRSWWSFGISNRPGPLAGDLAARLVNELLLLLHAPLPLVRIAFHPADLEGRAPFRHTLSLLRRLLAAGRLPVTYADLVAGR